MQDLNDALKQIERNDAPDLWPMVLDRDAGPGAVPVGTSSRRWSTILIAAVISVLALGFAGKAFLSSSPTPAGDASPSASVSTSPSADTIFVHNGPELDGGPDTGQFTPATVKELQDPSAIPFDQALSVFERDHPEIQLGTSDTLAVESGTYTAVNPDGTYRFQDRPAYGIELHVCTAQAPPSCDFWIFLDANTGHLLEPAWRP
jgi:hypothetical protein